jgi:hypothetical protein
MAGAAALTTSGILGLDAKDADAICILYLDHRSMASIRYSVRRLRKKFPTIPVAVCLWGSADPTAMAELARADATISTLREAIDFCAEPTQSERTALPNHKTVQMKLAAV